MICRFVKAACPAQAMDTFSPDVWAFMLDDVDFEDAKEAVRYLGRLELEPGKARYIEPGHIIGAVRKIRAARRVESGHQEPPPEVADNPTAYLAWLRATNKTASRKAIA
jgi:hypothetical protein